MGNFSLKIEDFQSIGDALLEFNPGVNLILGQSNSGKTAILRAINATLTNPSYAKTFIRHRTDSCTVTFAYNGHEVMWQKNAKGGTKYIIDSQEYSKLGTSDLFDILSDTGFVKSYNDEVMNIEGEWDLPFPFDRTPAELFRLFENVFCVSDSATILKSFKEEESDLVKQINDVKEKISRSISKINSLEELEKDVNLPKLKSRLKELEEISDEYFNLYNDFEVIKKSLIVDNFVVNEVIPPEKSSLKDYLELIKELSFLKKVSNKIQFYKTLPSTMEVPDTIKNYVPFKEDMEVIDNAVIASNFSIDKKFEIGEDLLPDYFNLLNDLEDIEKGYSASTFMINRECTEDSSLSLPDYLTLSADLTSIVNSYKKCKLLTEKCKELNKVIEEAENKLKEYKVCPLCGQELKGDLC